MELGCRPMNKFFDKPWFYKIIALLAATLLVIYIDTTQHGYFTQGEQTTSQQTATKKVTISVPLQVSVNTDRYYVTGYPEKVKMTLSGASALVTSTQNTQNFRVYIDLTKLSVGKHTIKVKVTNLNKQLAYSINPKKITVNIQRRKSRSLPVQIEYNKNVVPDAYTIGTAKADPSVVSVTGAKSEVNQINKIIAKVVLPTNTTKTFEQQVMLVAEDKKGSQLNVVINPLAVNVKIPITLPKKTVKIKLNPKNESSDKVYSLTAETTSVTIYGKSSALKKIKELDTDVDLKNVSSSQTKKIKLKLPNGVIKASEDVVAVRITVANSTQSGS